MHVLENRPGTSPGQEITNGSDVFEKDPCSNKTAYPLKQAKKVQPLNFSNSLVLSCCSPGTSPVQCVAVVLVLVVVVVVAAAAVVAIAVVAVFAALILVVLLAF